MLSLFKCFNLSILSVIQGLGRSVKSAYEPSGEPHYEATTIVIDEGTILAIKATITFISIEFDNVSRAMILATESAKKFATSSDFLC